MTGFDTYAINNYTQGMGGTGGVAIFVRKVIKSFAIDMSQCNDFIDAVGIRIQGRDKPLNLVCIYRRPGRTNRKRDWHLVFKNIRAGEGVIVTGDFNAHNELWNCDVTDGIGESLMEEFEKHNLFIQ